VLLAIADPLIHTSGLIAHLCSKEKDREDKNPTKKTKAFIDNKPTGEMQHTKNDKPMKEMKTLQHDSLLFITKSRSDVEEETSKF
jgi:hypothetical protein